jgi:hypothetical protein
MRHGRLCGVALFPIFLWLLLIPFVSVSALEEGEVTGKIERTNGEFLRDYETLDYKGRQAWEAWGKGLEALGWIVLQGDSGQMKDHLLLVIDTRTLISGSLADKAGFADLREGDRVRAKYRMGWDALHALELSKVDE